MAISFIAIITMMSDKYIIKDGNGFIDRRELGLMMRFMGENLSEAEIQVNI